MLMITSQLVSSWATIIVWRIMNISSDLESTKELTVALMALNTTTLIPTGYGVAQDCATAIEFLRERSEQMANVAKEIEKLLGVAHHG